MFRLRKRAAPDVGVTPEMSSSEGVEAMDTLKNNYEHQHGLDPNLPADDIEVIDAVLARGDTEKAIGVEVTLVEDDSPYPEVLSLLPSATHLLNSHLSTPNQGSRGRTEL